MIFSANISKALCLAAMGISLMMPAPVAAATPAMALNAFLSGRLIPVFSGFRAYSSGFTALVCQMV